MTTYGGPERTVELMRGGPGVGLRLDDLTLEVFAGLAEVYQKAVGGEGLTEKERYVDSWSAILSNLRFGERLSWPLGSRISKITRLTLVPRQGEKGSVLVQPVFEPSMLPNSFSEVEVKEARKSWNRAVTAFLQQRGLAVALDDRVNPPVHPRGLG